MTLEVAIASLVSLLIAVAVNWLFWRRALIVDEPDARSMHEAPVATSGGLGIVLALLVACAMTISESSTIALGCGVGILILALISAYDDYYTAPVALRLPVQVTVAAIAVWVFPAIGKSIFPLLYSFAGTSIVLVGLVWLINLFNFMDGMDGFSGAMSASGFVFFAILGLLHNQDAMLLISICGLSGVAGFLLFNWPPARIFMGDIGAIPLGFVFGFLSIWAISLSILSIWQCAVVFLPFWLDATVTLLRRVIKKEPVWQAHNTHYYQRFVHRGLSKVSVLWLEVFLMAICLVAGLGMATLAALPQVTVLTVLAICTLILWETLDRTLRNRSR